MWRFRAPSARRSPISRTRSSTETSMMFATPTPPMPSVSVPMKTSSTCRPIVMPSMIGRNSSRPNIWIARLSVPREALPLADRRRAPAGSPAFSSDGVTALKTRTLA